MLKSRWRMADMCCCHFEFLHSKVDNPNPSPNHPDGFVTKKRKDESPTIANVLRLVSLGSHAFQGTVDSCW